MLGQRTHGGLSGRCRVAGLLGLGWERKGCLRAPCRVGDNVAQCSRRRYHDDSTQRRCVRGGVEYTTWLIRGDRLAQAPVALLWESVACPADRRSNAIMGAAMAMAMTLACCLQAGSQPARESPGGAGQSGRARDTSRRFPVRCVRLPWFRRSWLMALIICA